MKFLRKLMGGDRQPDQAQTTPFTAPIAPEKPFFVIGDVHGCLDKLAQLLLEIEKLEDEPQVVVCGDMIDRGEHSAGVLSLLKRLNGEFGDLVTCLMGNHEVMLLRFLEDPETQGGRWLRNGGLQTLASYQIARTPDKPLTNLRDELLTALGDDMITWLSDLPYTWQSGNVAVVHAGADPQLPLTAQSNEVLTWGHVEFSRVNRTDETWIAHGHTIVKVPSAKDGRISVDTGAYATGNLSAAYIKPGNVSFLQTK